MKFVKEYNEAKCSKKKEKTISKIKRCEPNSYTFGEAWSQAWLQMITLLLKIRCTYV